MEAILKQIFNKLEKLDEKVEKLDEKVERLDERVEKLERLEPLVQESHQWIGILLENKEIQKAEMDNMRNGLARVEGVLSGFDKSLDMIRKAQ